MGHNIRGVACVTLKDVLSLTKSPVVLGVDSALAYHGLGSDLYIEHPVFVTDTLTPWTFLKGEPSIVGVTRLKDLEDTVYPMLKVTNVVDSILDTMQFNKYSEHIMDALAYTVDDEELFEKIRQEAKVRGITDLLDWELQEMKEYFKY